jgi:hypothetical protein
MRGANLIRLFFVAAQGSDARLELVGRLPPGDLLAQSQARLPLGRRGDGRGSRFIRPPPS